MVIKCQRFVLAVCGLLLLLQLWSIVPTGEAYGVTVRGVGQVSNTQYGSPLDDLGFVKVVGTLSQSPNAYITAGAETLYQYEMATVDIWGDVSMIGSSFITLDGPSFLNFDVSTVKMADSSSIVMRKSSKFIAYVPGISLAITIGESASITMGACSSFTIVESDQLTLQIGPNGLIQLGTHASVLFNDCGESNLCDFESGSKFAIGDYSSFSNKEAVFSQGTDSSLDLGCQTKMSNNGTLKLGSAAEIQSGDFVSIGIADGAIGLNMDESSSLRLDDFTVLQIDARAKLTVQNGISVRIRDRTVLHITAGMLCYAQADTVIPNTMNYTITANSDRPKGFFCLKQ